MGREGRILRRYNCGEERGRLLRKYSRRERGRLVRIQLRGERRRETTEGVQVWGERPLVGRKEH